ncbi:DUF456 domain-containing protein [Patescibacteria group bacterium]|nr:DUF456 domain-containing protein [Patescibacteria group bacterium]
MFTSILIWIIVFLFFSLGLLGILLPFLPGIPLIFLGSFIYAAYTDFREITGGTILLFVGITIFCFLIDYLSGIIGAKKYGASAYGILGAFLGMIIGLLTLGIVGLVVGPFIGAVILEIASGRQSERAIKVGMGTMVGFLAGTFFKFILGFLMIGIFLVKIIF